MSAFLDGLGKIFGKVADQFQGRIERLRNEKTKLLQERHEILKQPVTPRSSDRVMRIDFRVQQLNEALGAKAAD